MRNEPKPFQVYKHFKGNYYQIVEVAIHSETGERLVIYRPLFEGTDVYARPLEMFLSEVDHEKYPDVKQKYRFALVTGQHKKSGHKDEPEEGPDEEPETDREDDPEEGPETDREDDPEEGPETDREADPEEEPEGSGDMPAGEQEINRKNVPDRDVLDSFLDAQTSEEKLDILTGSWKTITEDNIDNIAVVLDMELMGKTLEEKYKEILNCLKLRTKYESSRLR